MMLLGPSRVVGLAGVRSACVLRAFSSGVSGGGESGRVQQLKTLVKQYGPVAMGVHISIGLVTLAGFYAAVKAGVDFSDLSWLGLDVQMNSVGQNVTTFTVAYMAYKTTAVARIPLTIAVTPLVARRFFGKSPAPVVDEDLATFSVKTVEPGGGMSPQRGDEVEVHYTGRLQDGKVFDSSVSRGVPLRFTLGVGMVIRGWDEGLLCMQEGGKALLVCPPDYAYGEGGMPPVIPPSATLLFDVELVKVHPRGREGGEA